MNAKHFSTLIAAVGFAFAPTVHAHDGHSDSPGQMPHYVIAAPLGDGIVKTYVLRSKEKQEGHGRKPDEIGIEIPASVMNNLPSTGVALAIDLPNTARNTPFQYMMLDWNPQGHEPAGIYDKPHFDFHFYIQDHEDVMDIRPGDCSGLNCDDYAKAMKPLPPEFTPQGYINVGSVVPFMGNHLIDPASPEFNGQPFTRTWLYGAYDGAITFYEPMITRQSLIEQPNVCSDLKMAPAVAASGYYPTKYCQQYDKRQKVYRVYITDFIYRRQPQ
jgi:hypothetical protein